MCIRDRCNRFEKKLHDLELTRVVSIQMGPQTRLLQNNDALMVEKIQSSLVNTIPLWKSQMAVSYTHLLSGESCFYALYHVYFHVDCDFT